MERIELSTNLNARQNARRLFQIVASKTIWFGIWLIALGVCKDWLTSDQTLFPYSAELSLTLCTLSPFVVWGMSRYGASIMFALAFVCALALLVTSGDKTLIFASIFVLMFREATLGSIKILIFLCLVVLAELAMKGIGNVNFLGLGLLAIAGVALYRISISSSSVMEKLRKFGLPGILLILAGNLFLELIHGPLVLMGHGLTIEPRHNFLIEFGILPSAGAILIATSFISLAAISKEQFNNSLKESCAFAILCLCSAWILAGHSFVDGQNPTLLLLVTSSAASVVLTQHEPNRENKARSMPYALKVIATTSIVAAVLASLYGFSIVSAGKRRISEWKQSGAWLENGAIQSKEVSQILKQATLAMEDREFYNHDGFDFPGLHRAIRLDIRALRFVQGGSTITQQAARYTFIGGKKTLSRKLEEAGLTVGLEHEFSKDQILAIYLNHANYGFDQVGIRAASQFYFSKLPSELNLNESIYLVCAVAHPPNSLEQLADTLTFRETACDRLEFLPTSKASPEELLEAASIGTDKLFLFAKRNLNVKIVTQKRKT